MEAKKITTLQPLKKWSNKEKGPIESEVFNLTNEVGNLFMTIWKILKTIGLLLFSIYCWIAIIRATPKLKPWITFTIELVIFFILAMIPITDIYIDKVKMRDKHSMESYKTEKKYEQEVIRAEIEGYNRGMRDAQDSLIKEGWVKIED